MTPNYDNLSTRSSNINEFPLSPVNLSFGFKQFVLIMPCSMATYGRSLFLVCSSDGGYQLKNTFPNWLHISEWTANSFPIFRTQRSCFIYKELRLPSVI